MNTSFQKNISLSLAIIAFSLFVSLYIVFMPEEGVFAQRFTEENRLPPQFDFVNQWNGGVVSGVTATDIGNGNNGTLLSGATVASGRFGKAFKLHGVGPFIQMGNPASLNFGTGPFSLDVWFIGGIGGASSIGNIIRKSNYPESNNGAGYWLRIGVSEGGQVLEFFTGETVGYENQPRGRIVTPINSSTWYRVVATRDDSGTMKLYVNGELKGIAEAPGADTTSDAPFTIGAWDDRFGVREFFSGLIEEVSIYERALSSSEITDAYKEMRQILAAKDSGVSFPGGCNTRQQCLKYCEAPKNAMECVDFAEAAGFISEDEAAQARKYIPLILQGVTPGKCDTKEQCEAYCENPFNTLECMEFAVKYEVLSKDELEVLKKILPFMREGKMPGGCRSKAECETYCSVSDHFEECLDLGLALGVIKTEEVELIRKSGGKGPGNCRSREACETFCSKQENQKECMDFAVKIGLMTQEEAEQAEAAGDVSQCFEEADEKIISCFITNLGTDVFEQMKAGKMPYDIAIIEKIRKAKACVKQYSDEATDVLGDFLRALPAADACVTTEFGADFIERLRKMTVPCSQMKGIKEKLNACFLKGTNALFEPCAEKECSQVSSCMLEVSKPLSSIVQRIEAGDPAKAQKRELPQVMQDKLNSCGIDPNFDPNTCISKSTCTEFFSCLNPSGKEQSPGDIPGEMPPELKSRMDSCMQEFIDTKLRECTDKQICSEVNACLKAQQQGGDARGGKGVGKKPELPSEVESKLMACQMEEIQVKLDACLYLSCSEFDACLKSSFPESAGDQDQQQQQQEPDPKIMAKVQACTDEKINTCLAKSCDEFMTCINALGQGGDDDGEQGQQQGQSNSAISDKVQSCQPKDGGGGGQPAQYPDQSQVQQQYPPTAPDGSSSEIPVTPELCANFSTAPACSYVGSPDSQNYKLCKQCYPDR